jgi:hypothetical protein
MVVPAWGSAKTTCSESVGGKLDPPLGSGLTFGSAPKADADVAPSFGGAPLITVAQVELLIPAFGGIDGEGIA